MKCQVLVNTDLTRLYGRAPSSQRAVDHAPLNTPWATTVPSSIRLDGEKAFTTYQGGTTGERFVRYLKETLLPTLWPSDIVVMDNIRSHHVKAVREILEAKGMKVLYLPPYSPDLTPIEKMWSKMKSHPALLENPQFGSPPGGHPEGSLFCFSPGLLPLVRCF